MMYKGHTKEWVMLNEITGIIISDSKDELISFVNDPVKSSYISRSEILGKICVFNSVKCATAFLESETGLDYPVDRAGRYPLHIAATNLYSDLVDLFLRHGARTDIPLCDRGGKDFRGLLPLDIALKRSRSLENLKSWTPGDSIFELITILCLPQLGYAKEGQRLNEITGIISSDSKDQFISFVNDPVRSSYISKRLVLEKICIYNSVNCATALLELALLESETVPGTDLNYSVDYHGRCPMHIAAMNLYSDLVDLFLRHGARTDIPSRDLVQKDFSGLLPLDIALKISRYDL
ncbi:hypothetical protein L1049_015518 [Liquidambar formosana]|uniref:Ankyrin repeat protein n=1 Tax=Liquidambar formosana TaxID=63359 RepID=A0AAP0X1X9_LIQFO